jgi:hypothetical protein
MVAGGASLAPPATPCSLGSSPTSAQERRHCAFFLDRSTSARTMTFVQGRIARHVLDEMRQPLGVAFQARSPRAACHA